VADVSKVNIAIKQNTIKEAHVYTSRAQDFGGSWSAQTKRVTKLQLNEQQLV
jgi:hypothetical protein